MNHGTGAAPPALLLALHGAGFDSGVWAPLSRALTLPLHTLTLPGRDGAETSSLPTVEDMGDWIKTNLDGVARGGTVVLIGHSMGGLAALETGGHPAIAGLVLMSAALALPVHPDLLRTAKDDPETARHLILKWSVPKSADGTAREHLHRAMARTPPNVLAEDLAACVGYSGGRAAAGRVTAPTLILMGDEDKMVPTGAGTALAAAIPGSKLHTLPSCGHMPMAEHPAETAAAIEDFVNTLFSRR